MTRKEYHAECLSNAIADAGLDGAIPVGKLQEIADAFVSGLEMEAESFGDLSIPNPQTLEIKELKEKLKKKDDNLDDVERAWFQKACRLHGLNPESYIFDRRGGEIEIMGRR